MSRLAPVIQNFTGGDPTLCLGETFRRVRTVARNESKKFLREADFSAVVWLFHRRERPRPEVRGFARTSAKTDASMPDNAALAGSVLMHSTAQLLAKQEDHMARNYVFVGVIVSGFVFGMGCTNEDPNSLTRDMRTSTDDLRANKGKGTTQRCAPSSDDGADDGDVSPHCDAGTAPAPAPSTTSAAPAPSTTSAAPAAAPAPATCASFTYSAWGACQPDGTQTRTVASSSPSGCTGGSPVTTQPCTSLDGAALYTQYCSGCHGTSKMGSSATSIQNAIDTIDAMKSLSTLTPEQIAAIAAAK